MQIEKQSEGPAGRQVNIQAYKDAYIHIEANKWKDSVRHGNRETRR